MGTPTVQLERALLDWLQEAQRFLASWDATMADDLDDIVERGLEVVDALDADAVPEAGRAIDSPDIALLVTQVISGLASRRDEVGAEIESLQRRRRETERTAGGIASYLAAPGAK